jgi:integrase
MRPRKKNRNLPERMFLNHGRYYYVLRGKWHPLSKDYAEALIQYSKHTSSQGNGMAALIDRFMVEVAVQKTPKTQKEYKRLGEKLKPIFAEFRPDQVKPHHVAKVIDHEAKKHPVQANRLRQFLSVVFSYGVRLGVVDSNPCRDVKGISVRKRDRYITDDEFKAVKAKANETIGCIMDFCYFTAQRISDVLKVRLSDITTEGVYFEQGKTGKKLMVQMSDELAGVIERAKGLHKKVRGFTLFHGRGGKQYGYFGVSAMFRRSCKSAGIEFHLHDIRAKSLTDAKRQGIDAQKLAGHKSAAMTEHYVKARDVEVAKSPKMGKVLGSD